MLIQQVDVLLVTVHAQLAQTLVHVTLVTQAMQTLVDNYVAQTLDTITHLEFVSHVLLDVPTAPMDSTLHVLLVFLDFLIRFMVPVVLITTLYIVIVVFPGA